MSKVTYTTPTTVYCYFINGQYADYYVSNDAWNVGGLVEGTNYSVSLSFDPNDFQAGTTFTWTYPHNVGGVYAYPNIGYDVPNSGISTTQVGNIASLSVGYSAALSNPTQSTLAFDLWFNSQPNGAWATTTDEVLIEVAPTSQGTPNQPFKITDSTITNASVYVSSASGAGATWTFIDVKAPTDMMSASLSLSDIFKTLIWNGVLTGNEYLTAIQFGSEVHGDSGSLQINSLGYSWTATPSLLGTSGNDTFVITNMGGNDVIGNGGVDTVVYSGSYSNYQIKSSGSEILITSGNNISTLDELQGVSFIQFSDGTYNVASGKFTSTTATPPSAPAIVSFSPDSGVVGDGITKATTLTLTGTATANTTVTVYDGTTKLGTSAVNASGAWNFTTGTLTNGTQIFTATDTDTSGNISATSAALAVTVDAVVPVVSSVAASGSGITNGTGDLNAGHAVTLTVNLSEAVTVAGGVPSLTLNDGGTATYSGGSGTNALTFSYKVAAGQNTADLAVTSFNLNAATVTDAAGNSANVTGAVANPTGTLQIDTTAPSAPVISSDSPAAGTAVTLVGTAEANSTVTVFDGTTKLGTATVNASGAWSFTTGALAIGSHTFTATATDAAGNVSVASQSVDPIVGTPAPVAPVIVSFAPDSGVVGDGITKATTLTVAGTATANTTVTVYDGTTKLGTSAVNASGAWNFTTGTLSNGTQILTATDSDTSGNISATSAALAIIIDTVAPNVPVISSDAPASGTAVTLTGTAEANSTVTVFDGSALLGTATASGTGSWSFTTGQLAGTTNIITATATDAAGNVSAVSQAFDVTTSGIAYSASNTILNITATSEIVTLSGSSDSVTVAGNNNTIQLSGSNDSLSITGSGNSVNVTGSNDSITAIGTDTITFGASGTLNATVGALNLANNLMGSGNNTLALTGNGGTVNLSQLAHFSGFSDVTLSGSNDSLILTNANLTVTRLSGSADTITLGNGIDTVAYTSVNQSTHNSPDTIIGFNTSQDKIDFSAINGLNSNVQNVTINFLTSTPTKIGGHTIDIVTSGGNTIVYANTTGSNENINGHQEDMQINITGAAHPNYSDFILHH